MQSLQRGKLPYKQSYTATLATPYRRLHTDVYVQFWLTLEKRVKGAEGEDLRGAETRLFQTRVTSNKRRVN